MHAVIFDIDGTLLDSAGVDDALYKDAVVSTLGNVRFRATLAEYNHVSDSGILAQVLKDNGISLTAEITTAVKSRFVRSLQQHISNHGPFAEISGASSMLETLQRSTDHSVALATGGWRESAQLKLATAGLDRFDIPLSTSDDAADRKDIMRIALDKIGKEFHSITYYGDGVWDREASVELGWQFVAVGPALGGIRKFDSRL